MQTSSCNFGFEQVPGSFVSCAKRRDQTTASRLYNAITYNTDRRGKCLLGKVFTKVNISPCRLMRQWLSLISKERKAPLEGDSELKIHLATLNLSPEEPHFH